MFRHDVCIRFRVSSKGSVNELPFPLLQRMPLNVRALPLIDDLRENRTLFLEKILRVQVLRVWVKAIHLRAYFTVARFSPDLNVSLSLGAAAPVLAHMMTQRLVSLSNPPTVSASGLWV